MGHPPFEPILKPGRHNRHELVDARREDEHLHELDVDPREAVGAIMKSVKTHAGTEPQSDDITVLGMKILA